MSKKQGNKENNPQKYMNDGDLHTSLPETA